VSARSEAAQARRTESSNPGWDMDACRSHQITGIMHVTLETDDKGSGLLHWPSDTMSVNIVETYAQVEQQQK
jgi:hypothetical protein